MRPSLLNPLFASVTAIKGIGDRIEKLLAKLLRPDLPDNDHTVRMIDLALHLPVSLIDRSNRPQITDLPESGIVTIDVTIGRHRPPPRHNRRVPYRVDCFDDSGNISLVFFHARGDYLARLLPEGERRFISGTIEWFNEQPQINHPDHMVSADEFATMPLREPVYPLTAGLSGKILDRAVQSALSRLPQMPEWQDAPWLKKNDWPDFASALKAVHRPETEAALEPLAKNRARLAYDELLANQLALALVRSHMRKRTGHALPGTGITRQAIIEKLPFSLTNSQKFSLSEILADMAKPERMMRLLQGDVGAGKTIIALIALTATVESGAQGALMAPTDILARQHLKTLTDMCDGTGLRLELLTGRDKGKLRATKLAALAAGEIDILIGTHALFQAPVEFAHLGLAVIDEQHRFGVHQRLALQGKAAIAPDILVMTATPIPRTLALTLYGDMEVSRLTEKPAGRQEIATKVMPMERMDAVIDGLSRALQSGNQVYWVCPLVGETDALDLAAAEERAQLLERHFPGRVGLVHGRLKAAEKDAVMARFIAGDITILVATTVIEVGVDVAQASIMVIENAERFGLAQLHQLRGRVGRGTQSSNCLLLYQEPLGATAKARLNIMRETQDGFIIAEEDLRLRGAGEMLGTRQSGIPAFRLANLIEHGELLAVAGDDARLILQQDPNLQTPRGEALRVLLYLFERDEAVRLLAAG